MRKGGIIFISALMGTITFFALKGLFPIQNPEPKNRSHYLQETFSESEAIKYMSKKDNYQILGKYKISYDKLNNLLQIANHYFGKRIDATSRAFDPNTQASELEETCKMIDSNKDFKLSELELSKGLTKIGRGNIIDLTK